MAVSFVWLTEASPLTGFFTIVNHFYPFHTKHDMSRLQIQLYKTA